MCTSRAEFRAELRGRLWRPPVAHGDFDDGDGFLLAPKRRRSTLSSSASKLAVLAPRDSIIWISLRFERRLRSVAPSHLGVGPLRPSNQPITPTGRRRLDTHERRQSEFTREPFLFLPPASKLHVGM